MKQAKMLTMTLFLILTMILTGGTLLPAEAAQESAPETTRTSILDVESTEADDPGTEIIALEEVTPPDSTTDETLTDETEVVSPDSEQIADPDVPTAGPIHSDLRDQYTEQTDETDSLDQPTEQVTESDGTTEPAALDQKTDATVKPGEATETDTVTNSNDEASMVEQDDFSTENDADSALNSPTQKSTDLDETDQQEDGTETIDSANGESVPANDTVETESDPTDTNTTKAVKVEGTVPVQIQIQPQSSQKDEPNSTSTTRSRNQSASPKKESTPDASAELTDSETTSVDQAENLAPEMDGAYPPTTGKDQLADQKGIVDKVVFLMKAFGYWLNQMFANLI